MTDRARKTLTPPSQYRSTLILRFFGKCNIVKRKCNNKWTGSDEAQIVCVLPVVLRRSFMEPFSYYAERNFMTVLIKLPEHIPEIQENSLLQKYTVILGNIYDGDDEENNNGDKREMFKCQRCRQFNKVKKIEKR